MKLYIVRHAAAIERNAEVPEEQRYLTPEGRDLIRKTARTLLQKKVNPDLILDRGRGKLGFGSDGDSQAAPVSRPIQWKNRHCKQDEKYR